MGFLDAYGLKPEDIGTGRQIAPAGRWNFVVGDCVVRKGTKNKPKDVNLLIEYQLSDADGNSQKSISDWFLMSEDGKVTQTVQDKLYWADRRLKELGFDGGLEDDEFKPDNVIGIRGTLEIKHVQSKGNTYANIVSGSISVDGLADDDDAGTFAEAVPEDIAAETKPAARGRGRKPAESPAADNPWETGE